MDEAPIYNSRIFRNYLEYLRNRHPEIDIAAILDHAGMTTYQLEDEGHWFTQGQADGFHEIISRLTDIPDISREVGRYSVSSQASGAIRQYLLGFVTPAAAYAFVEKIAAHVNRGKSYKIKNMGDQQIEVVVTQDPDVHEQVYQCQNRIGTLEALAKIFTDKYAKVDHPTCIHRGDNRCVYHVSWEEPASLLWRRIRNLTALFSIPLCTALPFFLAPPVALSVIFFCLALVFGVSYYAERMDRLKMIENIENRGDSASRLLDQINVSYNNTLLVQEIGQATSMILDIDQLLAFIMEALEKRLDFDRGMILLADRDKRHLVYTIGYGYSPGQRQYLENMEFHLDNPDSRGVFVVSYRKQRHYLINNVGEIENDISKRSLEFARKMGTHSFICVPIVFKNESLGVLVVDNIRSKRPLGQSDMSLLMGIAPQIAISISNAISYRKVTESEKRFRSLSESAPDIIYTLDTRGAFTYINPAWERILGHRLEEVLGRPFVDFVPKEETPTYVKLFKRTRDEGATIRDVIGTILHQDGSDRFFSISGAPNLDSEGRVIGVVGTFKDITDIKISETKLVQSYAKLQGMMGSTIQVISKIVESRDPYTAGHQERVAQLAAAIAKKMRLSDEMIASIRMAATLHDVGKINIPAELLSKPKQLNEIEMGMIRIHPEVGYSILQSIDFPSPVARIVFQHHERMDGSGYPDGMSGEEILMEARILAVADVVEAMASHRPYRPALGIKKALEEISLHRGSFYDATVVDTCLRIFDENLFHF